MVKDLTMAELSPALNVTLVSDATGLERVANFLGRTSVFGFDTETNVVKHFTERKLRTIQVGDRNEQYVIDLLSFAGSSQLLIDGQGGKTAYPWAWPIIDALRPGLDSKDHLKVGANLEFDYTTMLWALGVRSWNFYDVQLAEKVIYAGRIPFYTKGFYGLADLVERYCNMRISKDEQKGFDLATPLTQSQIEYAALDTRLPLAVMSGQKGVIEKAKLGRTVKVENEAIPAFGELHINGVLLSRDAWNVITTDTKEIHAANVQVLDTHIMPVVGRKQAPTLALDVLEARWRETKDKDARATARKEYQAAAREGKKYDKDSEKFEGEAAINYASSTQVLAALRTMGFTKKMLAGTNDKMLAKFSDQPVIKAIQDYRESAKILSTYGGTWLANINAVTGRVHSKFSQMGAETGRTSSAAPNIQNLPKLAKWRACFKARPGTKIITTDMAGAELRIMADDSNSEMWIAAFENDWDLHSVGAAEAEPEKWAAGELPGCVFAAKKQKCKCPVHNKLRDDNKSTNFGIGYGLEGASLAAKLHISKEEADKKLARWRKVNHEVHAYLVASGQKARMDLCAHDMIGRRRLFNKPDWKHAAELALERETEDAKKQGRAQRVVDSRMVGRIYNSMYGNIEREGKNMRIQGTNASIAKIAMGCGFDDEGKPFMWHLLPLYGAELQNMVHDEFDVEAPTDKAEACAEMVRDCILRAGAMVLKRVKMLSESHIADCWSK